MNEHIIWHPTMPGVIEAVLCPCCKVPLRKLVKSENLLESQEIGNLVIQTYLAAMATFPNYSEYEIEMEDGSVHVMPICKTCRDEGGVDERKLLAASQAAMIEESERTGTKPPPADLFEKKTRKEKAVAEADLLRAAVQAAAVPHGEGDAR